MLHLTTLFAAATAVLAAPAPTTADMDNFAITNDLNQLQLQASTNLLGDNRDSCNWVRCSQGDNVIWTAACRWDPQPASFCAICTWSGSTPTCEQSRSADAGGSAAIMMCGAELATIGC